MNRILVIRGGAIGDFILTLPALKALRDAHPDARIEIMGYKHIAALAEKRFYADAVRSIEYAALASFFGKEHLLDSELRDYFGGFDLIISYLFDPDTVFESNLRHSGAQQITCGPPKIIAGSHAAKQLAKPVEELGIKVTELAPRIFPSAEDRKFAGDVLANLPLPVVAVHAGSGSEQKNWAIENWLDLGNALLRVKRSLLVISGEADEQRATRLQAEWKHPQVRFARSLPLPHLAAALEHATFIGHDSGISHLAAAAGAKCILLFGPTDPAVWAPPGENVRVIRAANGDLRELSVKTIRDLLPL